MVTECNGEGQLLSHGWGEKEWFDQRIEVENEEVGDKWGHRWRGLQKFRYDLCMDLLRHVLTEERRLRILDIGCGLCDFTRKILKYGPQNKIYGIDISQNAIKYDYKKYPEINFEVGALPNLSFRDNLFDVIICLEVVYYLSEKKRMRSFFEMDRVLKPDSYLLFSTVLDDGSRYYAEKEFFDHISKYFEIVKKKYNYFYLYRKIESKILKVLHYLKQFDTLLGLSDENLSIRTLQKKYHFKNKAVVEILKRTLVVLRFSNRFHFKFLLIKLNETIQKLLRTSISKRTPVKICYFLTKKLIGEKGKTQIIVLAKNRKTSIQ